MMLLMIGCETMKIKGINNVKFFNFKSKGY